MSDRLEALHCRVAFATRYGLFEQLQDLGFLGQILLKLQVSDASIFGIARD